MSGRCYPPLCWAESHLSFSLYPPSPFSLPATSRFLGHFERRISFGYDADLTQVRAEFDGEHLRIIVPRQPMPMTFWGSRS